MPTDPTAPIKRRREARRQLRADLGVLAACLVVCLITIVLLFFDHALAQALVLIGRG